MTMTKIHDFGRLCKYWGLKLTGFTKIQRAKHAQYDDKRLPQEDQGLDSEPHTDHECVSESNKEPGVRQEILQRFETWLDDVLTKEESLEGIADEFLSDVKRSPDAGKSQESCEMSDFFSTWSAITALTQEVKLQGRTFKELSTELEPLSGLGKSIDTVLKAHMEALSEARHIATEASVARREHEKELLREAERHSQREVINVLLDTRDRLVRGYGSTHECVRKLEHHRYSNWLTRISLKKRHSTDRMLDIVKSLEKGYILSLDRLNEYIERLGVREIVCEGRTFNPLIMNVIDVEETVEVPDGTVLEIYRTGYMWNEDVLHPAQVKVARAPRLKIED